MSCYNNAMTMQYYERRVLFCIPFLDTRQGWKYNMEYKYMEGQSRRLWDSGAIWRHGRAEHPRGFLQRHGPAGEPSVSSSKKGFRPGHIEKRATPSEYQSPDVTLPAFDTIISLKVITVPFSLHGLSISSFGRFVNPFFTFCAIICFLSLPKLLT